MKDSIILAKSASGKEITVGDINAWIEAKSVNDLADFIYDRFYERYLKAFDFPTPDYKTKYKSGFLMMASSCLLIETYVSFTDARFTDTNRKSRKCFCLFFGTDPNFVDFSDGAIRPDGSIANHDETCIANAFYNGVRCGILHGAETRGGWIITRSPTKPLLHIENKEINATKFVNRLKASLETYRNRLKDSHDFDNDVIWIAFRQRINLLISDG